MQRREGNGDGDGDRGFRFSNKLLFLSNYPNTAPECVRVRLSEKGQGLLPKLINDTLLITWVRNIFFAIYKPESQSSLVNKVVSEIQIVIVQGWCQDAFVIFNKSILI